MGSVKDYFSSLGSGLASLVKGMSVTGKEFVTPKITEKYPENRQTYHVPERFRAILQLIYVDGKHRCIACGTCERVCPNGTITLETRMVDTPAGTKKKKLDKYIYDLGACTFCNLCVINCPTDALEFSNDFEQSVFTRSKLIKQLNYLPEPPEPELTEEQKAKIAAEKAAKIAAAKAAVEAKKAAAAGATPAVAPAAAEPVPGSPEAKALAAAKGDPEKEAKIRAALAKAAALKAAKAGAAPAADKAAPAAVPEKPAEQAAPEFAPGSPEAKALAAAKGDPEKEAKIRAALAKAAALKAAKANNNTEK